MTGHESMPVFLDAASGHTCGACVHAEYATPYNPARLARCVEYGKTVRLTRSLKCSRWQARDL